MFEGILNIGAIRGRPVMIKEQIETATIKTIAGGCRMTEAIAPGIMNSMMVLRISDRAIRPQMIVSPEIIGATGRVRPRARSVAGGIRRRRRESQMSLRMIAE